MNLSPSLFGSLRRGGRVSPLTLFAVFVAITVGAPIIIVFAAIFRPPEPTWLTLAPLVLPRYLSNTLLLLVGTGILALVFGVGCAWLVTLHRFPGAGILAWALVLPLAMPAYLMAYTYTTVFDFAGPIQTAIRDTFNYGPRDYWFPPIRSIGGAIVMLGFVLYPYVYLLTRAAFIEQSSSALEAARTLGHGPLQAFRRVGLPLARPAIVAGMSLVAMEALADYGTVQYFAVETFTTGIFLSWSTLQSPGGAMQLAAMLLGLVFLVLLLERGLRGGRRFDQGARRTRPASPTRLGPVASAAALIFCLLPIVVGFVVPVGILVQGAIERGDPALRQGNAPTRAGGPVMTDDGPRMTDDGPRMTDDGPGNTGDVPAGTFESTTSASYPLLVRNTLLLAGGGAIVTMIAASILVAATRIYGGVARAIMRVATLGYAIPGAVIGLGVLTLLGGLDGAINVQTRAWFGVGVGLLLSGTVGALIYAFSVRFLAVGVGAIESGFASISPNLDGAARSLGAGPGRLLTRIHLPLIRSSLFSGVLLVFVDAMKELPATIMIRPFNMDTLAIRVYQFASDELLGEASTAALTIVVVGLVPVLLLSRAVGRGRPRTSE